MASEFVWILPAAVYPWLRPGLVGGGLLLVTISLLKFTIGKKLEVPGSLDEHDEAGESGTGEPGHARSCAAEPASSAELAELGDHPGGESPNPEPSPAQAPEPDSPLPPFPAEPVSPKRGARARGESTRIRRNRRVPRPPPESDKEAAPVVPPPSWTRHWQPIRILSEQIVVTSREPELADPNPAATAAGAQEVAQALHPLSLDNVGAVRLLQRKGIAPAQIGTGEADAQEVLRMLAAWEWLKVAGAPKDDLDFLVGQLGRATREQSQRLAQLFQAVGEFMPSLIADDVTREASEALLAGFLGNSARLIWAAPGNRVDPSLHRIAGGSERGPMIVGQLRAPGFQVAGSPPLRATIVLDGAACDPVDIVRAVRPSRQPFLNLLRGGHSDV